VQPTYPPPPPPPMYYPPPPQKSNTALIVVLVVIGAVVVLGILAAIAIPSFLKYQKKAKRSEAELQLHRMENGLRGAYLITYALPEGDGELTPSTPCCEFPDRRCPVDIDAWMQKPWDSFGFEIDEPTSFQYSYQASGDTFTLRAVGDLDCDGNIVTYQIIGNTASGQPMGGPIERLGDE
jgi:type II secretory pathway pseudopilin PulG